MKRYIYGSNTPMHKSEKVQFWEIFRHVTSSVRPCTHPLNLRQRTTFVRRYARMCICPETVQSEMTTHIHSLTRTPLDSFDLSCNTSPSTSTHVSPINVSKWLCTCSRLCMLIHPTCLSHWYINNTISYNMYSFINYSELGMN